MKNIKGIDTYRGLLNALKKMSPEQLDANIAYYDKDEDEFYPQVFDVKVCKEDDEADGILDFGHVYFAGVPKH